jgi:hypothetical protein
MGMGYSAIESSGDVALIPRPDSLLKGALWHPDPSSLSGNQARQVLVDIVSMRSFLAAIEALAVERVRQACDDEARRVAGQEHGQPERFDGRLAHALAVSEVAVAEGISEPAAARLVNASEFLCGPQLEVLERLECGDLAEAHARAIVDEASTLPEHLAEEFGIKALAKLETRTGRRRSPGEFRRAVRDLRERLHPESIQVRKARATRDRCVTFKPEPDGMCVLAAFLPAEVGLAAFSRLDALARSEQDADPEDGRTLPQLRADALVGLVLAPASGGAEREESMVSNESFPSASMPAAEIVVHVPVPSLLGSSDEPALLEGYGLIDAQTARDLAVAAPTWQRLAVGATGVPLDLGRSAYRPPMSLRRFIEYRDGTCQFPGCLRPARRSEIDHRIEWQDGGTTDADNLQALCLRHHAMKSVGSWKSELQGSDVLWVSPLGGQAVAGPAEPELTAGERGPAEEPEEQPPPF